MKFNCAHFVKVSLYHISSLGMFIVFLLIGMLMLGTNLMGNFTQLPALGSQTHP